MKRSAADPSHARGEELREDAASWRTASFGSHNGGPRLTMRPARHQGQRRTLAYLEGDGGIRPLFFCFVFVVAVLGVAAVTSIFTWAQDEQDELQVTLQNGPVSCEHLSNGNTRFSTTVDLEAEFPFVRDHVLEDGVATVEWTLAVEGSPSLSWRRSVSISEDGHIEQVVAGGRQGEATCLARLEVIVPV